MREAIEMTVTMPYTSRMVFKAERYPNGKWGCNWREVNAEGNYFLNGGQSEVIVYDDKAFCVDGMLERISYFILSKED